MPRHALLTEPQRVAFAAPATEERTMVRHYTLTSEDLWLIAQRRGDQNRLGFAVLLCYLRFPGRVLAPGEEPPPELLQFVAEQLGLDPAIFPAYAARDQTRRAHLAELQSELGYRLLTRGVYRELAHWLGPTAACLPNGPALVARCLEELRSRRILCPPIPVVERLCAAVRFRAQRQGWRALTAGLTETQTAALDGLLQVRPGGGQSWIAWVRQTAYAATPGNFPKIIAAGPNPKYFGYERGVTYYNLVSDQFTGLNAVVVPGTLRDSLSLLALVLEQQTELSPTEIMTDTGAHTDVVFGLFWLLGYRFSPRLADIGGARYWRIDPGADYGVLNGVARHRSNLGLIKDNWDDVLRLGGSLMLGLVQATAVMRTLRIDERPTRLAQVIAELGRIDKTIHSLTYIDDEAKRRRILVQLNRGEDRHKLARAVFHGKRGELRQRYREGQEDQLGALGLVVNIIVLWNTLYIDAALTQLQAEGVAVLPEDVARLSPLVFEHINLLGRYAFSVPDAIRRGELRPLRNPSDYLEEVA